MAYKTLGKFYTDGVAVAVGAGESIPFQNSTTSNTCNKCGQKCVELVNGTDIVLRCAGNYQNSTSVYKISGSITYEATAVGDVQASMQANGIDIAGARGIGSLVAVGDFVTIPLVTIITVRNGTSGDFATITINNVNASSIVVSNFIVEKIA